MKHISVPATHPRLSLMLRTGRDTIRMETSDGPIEIALKSPSRADILIRAPQRIRIQRHKEKGGEDDARTDP